MLIVLSQFRTTSGASGTMQAPQRETAIEIPKARRGDLQAQHLMETKEFTPPTSSYQNA
jgi:hypothetical protein